MGKVNKWFKLEIIERFMAEEDLELFQREYDAAKMLNVGRETLDKER